MNSMNILYHRFQEDYPLTTCPWFCIACSTSRLESEVVSAATQIGHRTRLHQTTNTSRQLRVAAVFQYLKSVRSSMGESCSALSRVWRCISELSRQSLNDFRGLWRFIFQKTKTEQMPILILMIKIINIYNKKNIYSGLWKNRYNWIPFLTLS